MNIMVKTIFLSILLSGTAQLFATQQALFQRRPEHLKEQIDSMFHKRKKIVKWNSVDRTEPCCYKFIGIDDTTLLNELIVNLVNEPTKESTEENFYIIDVGAGNGSWGDNAQAYLSSCQLPSNKHIYILSLTGGLELDHGVTTNRNVTHYKIAQFNIENTWKEITTISPFLLPNKLIGKIDLIVTKATLRYFVDPIGTIEQLYALLRPETGRLYFDDCKFFNTFDEHKDARFTNKSSLIVNLESLINNSSSTIMNFNKETSSLPDLNSFLINKTEGILLLSSLKYSEKICAVEINKLKHVAICYET